MGGAGSLYVLLGLLSLVLAGFVVVVVVEIVLVVKGALQKSRLDVGGDVGGDVGDMYEKGHVPYEGERGGARREYIYIYIIYIPRRQTRRLQCR